MPHLPILHNSYASTPDWQSLTVHPVNSLLNFTPASDAERFNIIRAAMEQDGFDTIHPLTLYQGQVLDGRAPVAT